MATHTVRVRCSELVLRRLDELAEAYGGNRSRAIRAAVVEASVAAGGESPVMDYDELLRILGVLARQGSISAIRLLLAEYRRYPPRPAPEDGDVIGALVDHCRARGGNG